MGEWRQWSLVTWSHAQICLRPQYPSLCAGVPEAWNRNCVRLLTSDLMSRCSLMFRERVFCMQQTLFCLKVRPSSGLILRTAFLLRHGQGTKIRGTVDRCGETGRQRNAKVGDKTWASPAVRRGVWGYLFCMHRELFWVEVSLAW